MNEDDILDYPYNNYLKVRLELVLLRDDELQAKIMRIVEAWMVHQRKQWHLEVAQAAADNKPEPSEPEHYWVTISRSQFIAQLYMFDSARAIEGKKNTISKGTLRKALNALIDDKYLITRAQPGNEFGSTQYTINRPLVQSHMSKLPKNPWSYLGHNGNVPADPVTNFDTPPQLQILTLPPVTEFVSGELQNLRLPLTNLETGELQNLRLLIDSVIESKKDTNNNKDMSNDISVTRTNEISDESKNTVSDGGNGSSDFQEVPSDQIPNSQALGEKIEALIQEVDKPLPAQDEAPKNEFEPQTEALPPNGEIQPGSYSPNETTNKRTRKPRAPKSQVSLTDTTPIPPPVKPSEDQLWTPLTCMQLADYYRGAVLEENTRKGSKYQRAVEAAIKLVNQQRKTYQEVDRVFRFMKCLDKYVPDGLWDEWWDGKDVDLWNVGDHCNAKLIEIERKKKERAKLSGKTSQGNNTPPAKQEPTPDKKALIAAAAERLARMQQQQAI